MTSTGSRAPLTTFTYATFVLAPLLALGCDGGGAAPTVGGDSGVVLGDPDGGGELSDAGGEVDACGCVHGACAMIGEPTGEVSTACECEPRFGGALCDICAPGYAGEACDTCAEGYAESDAIPGLCEPDPCGTVDCSGRGSCYTDVTETGIVVARCACESAFLGDVCELCARGYEGDDCGTCAAGYGRRGDECVVIACLDIPCGAHGTCADADGDGAGECVCERGWSGRSCEDCVAGYVLEAGECVPDVCLGVDCGHGTCVADTGSAACDCARGWDGAACDACATGFTMRSTGDRVDCVNELPIRDRRLGRVFDAAAPWTITVNSPDLVDAWYDRYTPGVGIYSQGLTSAPRKLLIPAAVEFDGVDDSLWSLGTATIRDVESYSVFVVVSWSPTGGWQTILDSVYPLVGDPTEAYSLEALDDHTVRYRHYDYTSGAPDVVTSTDFDASAGRQLIVIERRPFLGGTALSLSNGTDTTSVEATNGPFQTSPQGLVGRCTVGGPILDCHLDGRLHELVTYNGALTAAERDAVVDYLRVKWGL